MTKTFIVSGTDTGIGKTVCSAMLTQALNGVYWKPMQSGTEDGTDTETIQDICGGCTLPERYVFTPPLSPHRAAELDSIDIDVESIVPPETDKALIIEGAGGLLVPVTRHLLLIDLFKTWNFPVILCARTALGTINHTLLSVEALKARGMDIYGLVFIGEDNQDNMRTIQDFSGVKSLGHIPALENVSAKALQDVFEKNFNLEDF